MPLSQFAFRLHERFTCEYNFFDAWLLDVRFERERAVDPKRRYPRCVAGARRAPPEDGGGAEMFMDCRVPQMPGARKARHVEWQLRDIADLLRDPALDDASFRTRRPGGSNCQYRKNKGFFGGQGGPEIDRLRFSFGSIFIFFCI
jgi:hypothetical protein